MRYKFADSLGNKSNKVFIIMSSSKVAVLSQHAPAPSPLMSQGIICNGMIYCSGSLGLDPKTGKFVSGDAADRTVSQVTRTILYMGYLTSQTRFKLFATSSRSLLPVAVT